MRSWSFSISLVEPAVSWLVETKKATRLQAGILFGLLCWLLGLGTVFSFNHWEDIKLLGFNFFEFSDFITANLMLPLGGLLMAIFVGWVINRDKLKSYLEFGEVKAFNIWLAVLRYVAPVAILWVTLEALSGILDLPWLSLLNLLG